LIFEGELLGASDIGTRFARSTSLTSDSRKKGFKRSKVTTCQVKYL
jgi:hypothetical protein